MKTASNGFGCPFEPHLFAFESSCFSTAPFVDLIWEEFGQGVSYTIPEGVPVSLGLLCGGRYGF
jgi:hypothetical protein